MPKLHTNQCNYPYFNRKGCDNKERGHFVIKDGEVEYEKQAPALSIIVKDINNSPKCMSFTDENQGFFKVSKSIKDFAPDSKGAQSGEIKASFAIVWMMVVLPYLYLEQFF